MFGSISFKNYEIYIFVGIDLLGGVEFYLFSVFDKI